MYLPLKKMREKIKLSTATWRKDLILTTAVYFIQLKSSQLRSSAWGSVINSLKFPKLWDSAQPSDSWLQTKIMWRILLSAEAFENLWSNTRERSSSANMSVLCKTSTAGLLCFLLKRPAPSSRIGARPCHNGLSFLQARLVVCLVGFFK